MLLIAVQALAQRTAGAERTYATLGYKDTQLYNGA